MKTHVGPRPLPDVLPGATWYDTRNRQLFVCCKPNVWLGEKYLRSRGETLVTYEQIAVARQYLEFVRSNPHDVVKACLMACHRKNWVSGIDHRHRTFVYEDPDVDEDRNPWTDVGFFGIPAELPEDTITIPKVCLGAGNREINAVRLWRTHTYESASEAFGEATAIMSEIHLIAAEELVASGWRNFTTHLGMDMWRPPAKACMSCDQFLRCHGGSL